MAILKALWMENNWYASVARDTVGNDFYKIIYPILRFSSDDDVIYVETFAFLRNYGAHKVILFC